MRNVLVGTGLVCVALLLTAGANFAQDGKEVTRKGKMTCAKCDLGESKSCATVVVVKEGKDTITYFFDKDSNAKHHGDICKTPKNGTVVGTVKEADKKKVISVKKVTFD